MDQLNGQDNLQEYPNPPELLNTHIVSLSLLQEALSIDSEHCFWSKLQADYAQAFPDLPHLSNYNRRRKRLAGTSEQLARLWGQALRPHEDTCRPKDSKICSTAKELNCKHRCEETNNISSRGRRSLKTPAVG